MRAAKVGDWAWASYEEGGYHGPFDTRELALADAASDGHNEAWLAKIEEVPVAESFIRNAIDADAIHEMAESAICDTYGNEDEVLETETDPAWSTLQERLRAVVGPWVEEFGVRVSWFQVSGAERVSLS